MLGAVGSAAPSGAGRTVRGPPPTPTQGGASQPVGLDKAVEAVLGAVRCWPDRLAVRPRGPAKPGPGKTPGDRTPSRQDVRVRPKTVGGAVDRARRPGPRLSEMRPGMAPDSRAALARRPAAVRRPPARRSAAADGTFSRAPLNRAQPRRVAAELCPSPQPASVAVGAVLKAVRRASGAAGRAELWPLWTSALAPVLTPVLQGDAPAGFHTHVVSWAVTGAEGGDSGGDKSREPFETLKSFNNPGLAELVRRPPCAGSDGALF